MRDIISIAIHRLDTFDCVATEHVKISVDCFKKLIKTQDYFLFFQQTLLTNFFNYKSCKNNICLSEFKSHNKIELSIISFIVIYFSKFIM